MLLCTIENQKFSLLKYPNILLKDFFLESYVA